MPQLVAKKDLRYSSRDYRAGETFDATDKDADILKAVGHADDAGEKAAPEAAETQDRPAQPQRRGRTYGRRDMAAER